MQKRHAIIESEIQSPNFSFLANLDPPLMHQAALAERYCLDDPSAALTKLRLFVELLAKNIAARFGVYTDAGTQQIDILKELKYRDVLDTKLADMFHSIRIAGNAAAHEGKGTARDALQNLRFAHQLAVYFYRVFKNPKFNSGPKKANIKPSLNGLPIRGRPTMSCSTFMAQSTRLKDTA